MGGGGGPGPQGPHPLDDGDGQRRALHRVCTGAQLVEEDQAAAGRLLQNAHDIDHMGRESGQTLLNALLIADIRQHPLIHGNDAAVPHRDVETALGHEGQEAQGLEGDGLAAGVGAGDDQGVKGVPQLDIDGHRLLGIQQRMAGLAQVDDTVPADLRPGGLHLVAQLAPGEDHVQVHQGVVVPLDILPVGGSLGGELRQDPLNLLLLLGLELDILVVGLHYPHRLHKEGGAGGGDIVDQARQVPLVLRLHRHHEAAVPLGDDGLLEDLGVAGRGDDPLEDLAALGLGRPHVPSDIRQLWGSSVRHGVLVRQAPLDLLLQEAVAVEGQKQVVDGGFLCRVGVEVLLAPAGGGQQVRDGQQLVGIEAAAPVRPVQGLRHRLDAGKGGTAPQTHHLPGRVRLIQQAQYLLRLRLRPQAATAGLGLSTDRLLRQKLQHPGQFQGADGFFKQFAHSSISCQVRCT